MRTQKRSLARCSNNRTNKLLSARFSYTFTFVHMRMHIRTNAHTLPFGSTAAAAYTLYTFARPLLHWRHRRRCAQKLRVHVFHRRWQSTFRDKESAYVNKFLRSFLWQAHANMAPLWKASKPANSLSCLPLTAPSTRLSDITYEADIVGFVLIHMHTHAQLVSHDAGQRP